MNYSNTSSRLSSKKAYIYRELKTKDDAKPKLKSEKTISAKANHQTIEK